MQFCAIVTKSCLLDIFDMYLLFTDLYITSLIVIMLTLVNSTGICIFLDLYSIYEEIHKIFGFKITDTI